MFIQIYNTPNPNSIKLIVEEEWIDFIWECKNENDAKKSVLAESLWGIDGITYLMFGRKFVAINKKPEFNWDELTPILMEVISDFLNENKTLFGNQKIEKEKRNLNELDEKILKVINEKIQPAIESHGGIVEFISFDQGILKIELKGACKGCPGSESTLTNGIKNLMQFYFPEIEDVLNIG